MDDAIVTFQSFLLSHPNAWQRDTAFRLLSQKWSDYAYRAILDVIAGNASPQGKVAALHLRQRFARGRYMPTIDDQNPRVREALLATANSAALFPAKCFRAKRWLSPSSLAWAATSSR